MELKIKYINMNKLGDVFERHQSHTLWCPVCLQEFSGIKGICSYVGGGGAVFCKDSELFMRLPWASLELSWEVTGAFQR